MGKVLSIKDKVEQRVKDQEANENGGGSGSELDSKFIIDCLNQNELGDGNLFKKLYRKKFVFNKSMDCWMSWTGHHWKLDKMDSAIAAVEGVARSYQDEAKRLSTQITELEAEEKPAAHLKLLRKMLNNRVSTLRASRRRKNCVLFAHTSEDPVAIDGVEIDQKPWLFPCANGVINLKTGELEPGRQTDYLLKASPTNWPDEGIDSVSEPWEKSLLEIFSGNKHLVEFYQRICGYSLVGEVHESIMVVLHGRGRNGKSLLVETKSKAIGALATAIPSEMLLAQNKMAKIGRAHV